MVWLTYLQEGGLEWCSPAHDPRTWGIPGTLWRCRERWLWSSPGRGDHIADWSPTHQLPCSSVASPDWNIFHCDKINTKASSFNKHMTGIMRKGSFSFDVIMLEKRRQSLRTWMLKSLQHKPKSNFCRLYLFDNLSTYWLFKPSFNIKN